MGKKLYIGVDGKARKVKKVYVGVDTKARKVKKMYMGINGVARCIFSGGELSYYGDMYYNNAYCTGAGGAATTVGSYAVFGGRSGGATVTAYDTSLIQHIPEAMGSRQYLSAASVGNYAIFGTGSDFGEITAYDTSLVKKIIAQSSSVYSTIGHQAATSVGNYALFGGGAASFSAYNTVHSFDTSLSINTFTISLSNSKTYLAATSVGNYALFGGGYKPSDSSTGLVIYSSVDAFDTSLTRTLRENLTSARYGLAATTVGNYALFGGGIDSQGGYSDIVDVYNTSLTKLAPIHLSIGRTAIGATSVGDYALFGGGTTNPSYPIGSALKTVDVYDSSLTCLPLKEFTGVKYDAPATSVGNYALFGGSYNGGLLDILQVA